MTASGSSRSFSQAKLNRANGVADVQLDPLTIGVTAIALVAVVLLAAWSPARRAAQIQPTLALKEQ